MIRRLLDYWRAWRADKACSHANATHSYYDLSDMFDGADSVVISIGICPDCGAMQLS